MAAAVHVISVAVISIDVLHSIRNGCQHPGTRGVGYGLSML